MLPSIYSSKKILHVNIIEEKEKNSKNGNVVIVADARTSKTIE